MTHLSKLCGTGILVLTLMSSAGCDNEAKGALIGAGVGALAGGVIGNQDGKTAMGAGVGAAAGAATGAWVGARKDKRELEEENRALRGELQRRDYEQELADKDAEIDALKRELGTK